MSSTTSNKTTNQAASAGRIHRTLGRTTAFWRGFTSGELLLFAIPILLGIGVLGFPLTPSGLFLPVVFSVGLLELGLLVVNHRCPNHYRLAEWLAIRLGWRFRPKQATLRDDENRPLESGQSQLSDEDTRHLARLTRVHPYGVERDDGALVGAIEITPANMALRDRAAWTDAAESLAELADSTIEFDVQLFVTTTTASGQGQRAALTERLTDPDVKRLAALRAMVSDRIAALRDGTNHGTTGPTQHAGEQETRRRYYAVVAVDDATISEKTPDQDSAQLLLGFLPVVGRGRSRTQADDAPALDTKRRVLEERLDAIRSGVAEMPRCSTSAVPPRELAGIVHDYWTGPTATGLASNPPESSDTPSERTGADEQHLADAPGVVALADDTRAQVAPTSVQWEPETTVVDGEQYVRTFWIEQFPEHPENGLFERLLLDTELRADLSIHISPIDREQATDAVAEWISTLQTTRDDGGQFHAADTDDEIARANEIRELIKRNETGLFRVGVFVRLSAPSRTALRRRTRTLEALLRDAPANCIPKRVSRQPEAGLVTVSPIGRNELGRDRSSVMTGDAVGALFPFSSTYLQMDEGIEYGRHGHNESTIRIDPWGLETGHSELITGTPGAGKTHGAQARCLRTLARDADVTQVIVDPVGDMRETARALDATEIGIANATAINPCALHPPSEWMRDTAWELDPVAAKKEEVFALIENFLAARDVALDTHSGIITYAIDRLYAESAIDPDDYATHTPANSPTLGGLLDILEDLSQHPERHAILGDGSDDSIVADRIAGYAADLAIALEPFRDGSIYAELAGQSEQDLLRGESRVVYIDLQEIEGTSDGLGKQSFLMQLLLSQLYQQAKHVSQRVEVVIDEAHYLCNDDANLTFLNQIARHQRHAGLRLVLLSQTLREFYSGDAAEEIAGMCPIKIHHREPELDEQTAERCGLSADQRWFIQNAAAGSEATGYSEALLRVDEHGDYPLTVASTRLESFLIEQTDGEEPITADAETLAATTEVVRLEQLLSESTTPQALANRSSLDCEDIEHRLEHGLPAETLLDGLATALESEEGDGHPEPESPETSVAQRPRRVLGQLTGVGSEGGELQ